MPFTEISVASGPASSPALIQGRQGQDLLDPPPADVGWSSRRCSSPTSRSTRSSPSSAPAELRCARTTAPGSSSLGPSRVVPADRRSPPGRHPVRATRLAAYPRSGSATLRLPRQPNYRRYAGGSLVSNTGTWMGRVARSPAFRPHPADRPPATALGTVTGLQFCPFLLLRAVVWGRRPTGTPSGSSCWSPRR